jgi:hypothetical protein
MADAPAAPARPRFEPGWAFAAAAFAFVVFLVAQGGETAPAWRDAASLLAAFAMPGWVAVGILLVNRPAGDDRRAVRTRALTTLTATLMAVALAGAVFALLYTIRPLAAWVFLGSALVMVFWVDRAS